jgi:hypothetical protein
LDIDRWPIKKHQPAASTCGFQQLVDQWKVHIGVGKVRPNSAKMKGADKKWTTRWVNSASIGIDWLFFERKRDSAENPALSRPSLITCICYKGSKI